MLPARRENSGPRYQARQSGPVMDLVRIRAAWSRLPAQDALAPKNLYVRVSIQLTAYRFSQLAVVQLQLLSDTVKHRMVAGRLV